MTTTKTTLWMKKASRHVAWNPEDNKEDYKCEVNTQALCDLVKEKLKTKGVTSPGTLDKVTTEWTMGITNLLYLFDVIDSKDYESNLLSEADPRGKTPFPMDQGEEFVKACEGTLKTAWGLNQKGGGEPIKVKQLPVGAAKAVDSLLKSHDISPFNDLVEALEDKGTVSSFELEEAKEQAKVAIAAKDEATTEAESLRQALTKALASSTTQVKEKEVKGDGSIPSGKLVYKSAKDVFGRTAKDCDFEVPFWEWDAPHPDVPEIDENYIFRPKLLKRMLYALITNQRAYLQGHTGSGKTTLIEQMAAHLNYPFLRINFDSEISRMDLIGRDTLTADKDGNTISRFIDGILPKAMSSGYICCFDEIDFARPDVAYVMQAALEGNGLRITEDGDRVVEPDPMFRMFGTGNTVGQGDEHGMYQGARAQSLAFLDRFTIWCNVEYLTKPERKNLVQKHYPTLTPTQLESICKYTDEHLTAFTQGDILQPISPRGMLAIAKATTIMGDLKEALYMTIIDRASQDDKPTLIGLVDRVA